MSDNNVYEFGEFQLDCKNFTLHRGTETISLQPRVFDTLVYLVEHAGVVVRKEELMRAVWGETDVQDNAVMRCVSQLRKLLDDVEADKYIRTIPGKGYQFNNHVTTLSAGNDKAIVPRAEVAIYRRRLPVLKHWLVISISLSAILIIVFASLLHRPKTTFTAIQLTTNSKELPLLAAAISPDGNIIAFADETGLYISDVKIIERHSLALPKGLLTSFIDWSPDSTHLIVSSNNPETHQASVWNFSVLGGAPALLLHDATKAVISPDGSRIAFVRNNTELWLANADGSAPTLFAAAAANKVFNYRPQFSPDNQSIITGSSYPGFDHVSIELRNINSGTTRTLFETEKLMVDFRLLGSNELIISWYPGTSSWATNLVSVKVNLDTGALLSARELAVMPNYGTTNISITHNGNAIAVINERLLSDVYLADLQANGTSLSNSRRLTLNDSGNRPSGWLADNRTVLFYSNRFGPHAVYRQAIDSVDAYSIVADQHHNVWPTVSADQRWLFYFAFDSQDVTSTSKGKLMRMPLAGGASTVVDAQVSDQHSLRCAKAVNRCIFASHDEYKTIYFEFDPEKGRGRELARAPWKSGFGFYNWDFSADGTRIAFIDAANGTDVIGIITLDRQPATITQLRVTGQETLRTLQWDAPGKGFYVTTHNNDQDELQLLHIATDGTTHLLRQQLNSTDGWAIPSPDGKHLAYQKYSSQANIWLLQRQ